MVSTARTDFISVSRACKNKNLSVRKVLDYLTANDIIPKAHKKKEFLVYDPINIISTGDTLRIIEEQFISYLEDDDAIYDLSFNDETTELLDMVEDPEIRFRRISEATAGKKIAFIDAEFKDGNYHEISYEIVVDGVVIESDYFLESKHFKKMLKKDKTHRHTRLKEHGRYHKIIHRKHINRILKEKLNDVEFIIAHNAYGERNILAKNRLNFDKSKFICTSKMTNGFILGHSPSLMEIVEFYKLGYDSHFTHYAFEDTAMARKAFYRMIEHAKEKFGK
jgi:hypothetical protein